METKEKFETYVKDLRTELEAAKATGGVGDDDLAQLETLIDESRTNITQADDSQQAEAAFEQFKKEAERYAGGSV